MICALLSLSFPVSAQNTVPYQKLLLLIAGPSGDRIDPTEQAVVGYLNELRGEYGLYNLQMGTMHFDRPRENKILSQGLGFRENAGVTVALVQLSDQGIPVRTLYKRESVTPNSLQAEHKSLLGKWSDFTGQELPAALRPATSTTAQIPPINDTPPVEMSDNRTSTQPLTPPESGEVYSFEGIRSVITDLQKNTEALWNGVKNQPLREDRMDVPVREALLEFKNASEQLLAAHKKGVIYPLAELEQTRIAGRRWKLTEPRIYLPVEFRKDVQPILILLKQLEAIEYQGRKS